MIILSKQPNFHSAYYIQKLCVLQMPTHRITRNHIEE